MLKKILATFTGHPSFEESVKTLRKKKSAVVHGLGGSSSAFYTAALYQNEYRERGSLLAVLPDEEAVQSLFGDIREILPPERLACFPERDTSPYEHADSHVEVRSQRIETLDKLEHGWSGIVIASIAAIHDPTTPKGLLELVTVNVATGQQLDFDGFVGMLAQKGFRRERVVSEAGQIAVRGGIVDVFPYEGDVPYRIEFWGDRIESIRAFSTKTQRSIEKCERIRIIPPDECITEMGIDPAHERRIHDAERRCGINLDRIRTMFGGGDRINGAEQYLHLVFGEDASLERYFTSRDCAVVFEPDECLESLKKRCEHAETIFRHQRLDDPDLPSPEVFIRDDGELMETLTKFPHITIHEIRPTDREVVSFAIATSRQYGGNLAEVRKDLDEAGRKRMGIHIACDNAGQADRLRELLDDLDTTCTIDIARLSGGFTDAASGIFLVTDHEIFGRRQRRTRYRRFKEGVPIPDFRALKLGDFVVHVDYGIGKYRGLKRITAGGVVTDCLEVQYSGDDRLFVPVDQLKRLKKYTAEEGAAPVVSRLGGTAWERLKERTKKSIERLAKDLLKLYAERKAFRGFAFVPDEHLLRALEESFIYEETPDQLKAWREVAGDMMLPSPMERLICGDVGFGKTEVAIRAAFLAVMNGKQVVILVPTTILADQHEDTFRERFADFPVRIETISRFKTRREQTAILERLVRGEIDIVIGTHRLLSRDVALKDLGLLIVDEEQRFGVRHKERMKTLRKSVDVLSMSATPIPRTLNMSLLGARDITFINTPPPDRYSVHTEIVPFSEQYIVEAILHEIDRQGQVFFVHNRVQSIESMAAYLRRLLPEVSFCVVHGQMPERQLEQRMRDFYHGKYQVLVTTMIIENGLDIPSVNTILVNRADTFGLSQLYQLRGRVGRSSVRAFAYLLVPPRRVLGDIAKKRLRTIEEMTALGSGFNVAMRDLELRGAGNILGTEQSGFIAAVGFDLYTELLNETIAGLRGEKREAPPDVEVSIRGDAYIPEEYIEDAQERVQIYRRLSETVLPDQVKDIEDELADRFGKLSDPVKNLLSMAYIRHYAGILQVHEVIVNDGRAVLAIPESIDISRNMVEEMVKKSPVKVQFSFERGMRVTFRVPARPTESLDMVKKVLQDMAG